MFYKSFRRSAGNDKSQQKCLDLYNDANGQIVGKQFLDPTSNINSRIFNDSSMRKVTLSDKERYLERTRNRNKFIDYSLPEFVYQNAWVKRSTPLSQYPDSDEVD